MTRKVSKLLALALALMFAFAAMAEVPAFEDIVFPEVLPGGIILDAEGLDYSYDDLSVHYDISIITENYGTPNVANEYDPIIYWLEQKFNVTIEYRSVDELNDIIPSLAASDDLPDLFMPPSNSRDFAFGLDDAGKLIDAREIYPYMPLTSKYVTQAMIANSTNPTTGNIPFVTSYGIQDGIWTNAIRKDWLDQFGMDYPTNVDELRDFAEAVKTEDPDGNGEDDTYLFGIWRTMYSWCQNAFGNSAPHVDEEGKLSHMYFNGVRYGFLELMKEFYEAGYLHPDWDVDISGAWNRQKTYTANDKLGALYYPVSTLLGEYCDAKGEYEGDVLKAWEVCVQYPFGDGEYLYPAAGAVGYRWLFPKANYEDEGKLLRVAHLLDTCRAGGENYFAVIQNSIDEVYEFYADAHEGVTKNPNYSQTMSYTPEGYFYITRTDATPDNADDNQYMLGNIYVESYDGQPIQALGLAVAWQLNDPDPNADRAAFNAKANEHTMNTASVSRYPNTDLMYTLSGEAAEANNAMGDWITASEIAFIKGEKELTEETYAAWAQEWLDRGGYAIVSQMAEGLGCELPAELVK
ncbi:MAG: extracellular solute-binding protein [Clostridia bacterium]|nr:extracellular solute-binding protein [Clostridia bacterium]